MKVPYEKILELDNRYEEIVYRMMQRELKGGTEEELKELHDIKSELYEIDKYGISTVISHYNEY